ncbi:MAG: carboxypeptidase regulatory-like domain-containing protein [candidate division KSB1 bacterium]|nr:carboxypeptidase regulatory-like domain-containing protein [candidate division KSB1 bacterium]MDZ7305039.1 carboxypeptidase regulatory-like domain-containing protein [candidate division KSB1 bacterium]MDZ7312897.1 carboxypeptidase regulatory-like domain-containing protein [candidate division KSB1 bacterium]
MPSHFIPIKQVIKLALVAGCVVALQNCRNSPTEPSQSAKIEGRVLEKRSATPIVKALVKALPFNTNTETDADGKYVFSIELPDSATRTVTLVVSKTGFLSDTLEALTIRNNKTTTAPDVKLAVAGTVDPGRTSGDATNIVLVNVTASNIYVIGSGGQVTSDITFEVRDANGIPVDIQHQVTVTFKITGGPGGGEYCTPTSLATDAAGRVTTTITSGTIAGALQVVAEAVVKTRTITAAPVPIAIHGWLPDKTHFSVVPEKLNFAGFNIFGLENKITAFVGDKYSNPVPPGTAVQFRSTGGIIEGSAVTDKLGRATVSLLSASPQPQGISGYPAPYSEPGFALITAETVDENRTRIRTTTVVLFSGRTQISVTPTTFNLAAFASQRFDYTVKDQNNNPLVAGTTISVTTDNGKVSGNTSITLKDTQSRAYTQFSFILTNSQPDSVAKDATVKIDVTSQNGDVTSYITGKMLAKK